MNNNTVIEKKQAAGSASTNLSVMSETLGLPRKKDGHILAQGRVDPVTRGAVCIKSQTQLNDNGAVSDFKLKYWYRLPDNRTELVKLFDVKSDHDGKLESFLVAGREIDLNDPKAINAGFEAIRRAHEALKNNNLPEMAKIFHDCDLAKYVKVNVKITGQKTSGGFDFDFNLLFNKDRRDVTEELSLPSDPVLKKALFGLGMNSYAKAFNYQSGKRDVHATHIPTNSHYTNTFDVKTRETGSLKLTGEIKPHHPDEPTYYGDLVKVFTKVAGNTGSRIRDYKLDKLVLAEVDMTDRSQDEQMKAIGAINGMMRDVANHNAPKPMQHMAEYDLINLVTTASHVAQKNTSDKHSFNVISLAGNRMTPIVGSFGDEIGACKLITFAGVTILHDFGFKPAGDGSPISGAIPNIQDWKDHIDLITITHGHLDHKDGVAYEDLHGKDLLCAPQVEERIKDQMRTVHGSKARYRHPNYLGMERNGFKVLSKDEGKSGIVVIYSPNATPHTSYCTPYYYAAFYTDGSGRKRIRGVYVNMGDVRDENNVKDWFFKQGWKHYLKKAIPGLKDGDIPDKPTLAEWDSTSVRYFGETPKFDTISENKNKVIGWLEGTPVLDAHLASSDMQFDAMIRAATKYERDFTAFGKNMELTQRIQNIFGYKNLNKPRAQGQQNQIHMDSLHREKMQSTLTHHDSKELDDPDFYEMLYAKYDHFDGMKKDDREAEVERLFGEDPAQARLHEIALKWFDVEKKMERLEAKAEKEGKKLELKEGEINLPLKSETYRLYLLKKFYQDQGERDKAAEVNTHLKYILFQRLSDFDNNYRRYQNRKKWSGSYETGEPKELGPLVITRNTLTSRLMFEDNPQNMFVAVTGTQGNEVEVEAQLIKYLEGRSLMNQNATYRHTVRPFPDDMNPVIIISQPVIPGNDAGRRKILRMAADEQKLVVFNATHDGYEIYNFTKLPLETQKKIKADLAADNVSYDIKSRGNMLVVSGGMPIGYRGHGREDDVKMWMKRVNADMNTAQHIPDPEAAQKIRTVAASVNQRSHPLVEDFEIMNINRFRKDGQPLKVKGRIPAGIVLIRSDSRYQKPYRQIIQKQRIVRLEQEGCPTHFQPLLAGCDGNTDLKRDFEAFSDTESWFEKHEDQTRAPDKAPAVIDMNPITVDEKFARRPGFSGAVVPGQRAKRRMELLLN